MYVIFEDGSRQYRVSEGELVKVDHRDAEPGSRLEFTKVLLLQAGDAATFGRPYIEGARVVAEVVGHPSTKYSIQKFRRRKNYRRRIGHRQHFTAVKINHILGPGQELPPEPKQEAKSDSAAPDAAAKQST